MCEEDKYPEHKDTRCGKHRCACDYYNGYEFDNSSQRMSITYDRTQSTTKKKWRK